MPTAGKAGCISTTEDAAHAHKLPKVSRLAILSTTLRGLEVGQPHPYDTQGSVANDAFVTSEKEPPGSPVPIVETPSYCDLRAGHGERHVFAPRSRRARRLPTGARLRALQSAKALYYVRVVHVSYRTLSKILKVGLCTGGWVSALPTSL